MTVRFMFPSCQEILILSSDSIIIVFHWLLVGFWLSDYRNPDYWAKKMDWTTFSLDGRIMIPHSLTFGINDQKDIKRSIFLIIETVFSHPFLATSSSRFWTSCCRTPSRSCRAPFSDRTSSSWVLQPRNQHKSETVCTYNTNRHQPADQEYKCYWDMME